MIFRFPKFGSEKKLPDSKQVSSREKRGDVIVTRENTVWVFVAAGGAEGRHISDLLWGISVLKRKGVRESQIYIFTDFIPTATIMNAFGINKNIFHAKYLKNELQKITGFKHMIMAVSGHGTHIGLPVSGSKLAPNDVIQAIRSCSDLESGTLILGQCYAGVFNFLPASDKPEIVIMGATNLYSSLSATITLKHPLISSDLKLQLQSWLANIFLFYIFDWILNPTDIDGDGKVTVADMYKYAGVRSNQHLLLLKSQLAKTYDDWCIAAKQKLDDHESGKTLLSEIEKKSIETQLENNLSNLYLHQEPWLLHATLARDLNIRL